MRSPIVANKILRVALAILAIEALALFFIVERALEADAFARAKEELAVQADRVRLAIEDDYSALFLAYGDDKARFDSLQERFKKQSVAYLERVDKESDRFRIRAIDGDDAVFISDDSAVAPCLGGECLTKRFRFEPWNWTVTVISEPAVMERDSATTRVSLAAIIALTAALLFAGAHYAVRSQIHKPLRAAIEQLTAIGEGRFEQIAIVRGNYEMDSLADKINALSRKMRDRDGEIAESRAKNERLIEELEDRVSAEVLRKIEEQKALVRSSRIDAMNEVLNLISHHWRRPINRIGLAVKGIQDRAQAGDISGEYLREAAGETMREVAVLSDALDNFKSFFAKSAAPLQFSIAEEIERTIELIKAELDDLGVAFALTPFRSKVCAGGDPQSLRHALLNLLIHAKDAIESRKIKDGKIEILCEIANSRARITIDDNGGGMSREVLTRIFEPFVGGGGLGGGDFGDGGRGAGLYMSKFVIEANFNGSIKAENIDRGARFIIELPIVVIVADR